MAGCFDQDGAAAFSSAPLCSPHLVCPRPLPDELASGYLGRCMLINGCDSPQDLARAASDGCDSRSTATFSVAAMAGLSMQQFFLHHTMWPHTRCIAPGPAWVRPGLVPGLRGRVGTDTLRFCTACIDEDIAFPGIDYWRRAHQIVGQVFCPKHLQGLLSVPRGHSWQSPPHAYLPTATRPAEDLVAVARSSAPIQRFLDIGWSLMLMSTPASAKEAVQVLRERAEMMGLEATANRTSGPKLSEVAHNALPNPWLSLVLPPKPGSREASRTIIDNALLSPHASVTSFLIAAALLFEQADDALNALLKTEERPQTGALMPAPTFFAAELDAGMPVQALEQATTHAT